MAKTEEGEVKEEVDRILKKYDVWYFKPVSRGYGKHGIPDYICCIKGSFLAIETKKQKGNPTILQTRCMDEITKAGGMTMVVRPDTLRFLEEFICKRMT